MMPELYVGLMSGTSMDGIDAALVDFSGLAPRLIQSHDQAWPEQLVSRLHALRLLDDHHVKQQTELDRDIGRQFALATQTLLSKANIKPEQVIAIGSHGQTVRHRPDHIHPFSLQLGNAETLANSTGINVVSDFRTADIEAGGQGAPLAPAFHHAVLRSEDEDRCILNIGGIANLTLLHADTNQPTRGFDTGPGNTLMDAWTQHCLQQPYDKNATFAQSGSIDQILLEKLLQENYLKLPPPKSTGFELFNLAWLQSHNLDGLAAHDVQATLCEFTAISIAQSIRQYAPSAQRILVCGGGVHNPLLMQRIAQALPDYKVDSTASAGLDPDWVEAIAFAWLARRHLQQQTGNLPSVTGAKQAVILGQLTHHC